MNDGRLSREALAYLLPRLHGADTPAARLDVALDVENVLAAGVPWLAGQPTEHDFAAAEVVLNAVWDLHAELLEAIGGDAIRRHREGRRS